MVEICCEVVSSGSEATADACKSSSRVARRRRMQLRRIKLVSGVEAMVAPKEPMQKRQRLEFPASSLAVLTEDHVGDNPSGTGSEESSGSSLRRNPTLQRGVLSPVEPLPRYGMTMVCGRRREMEDAASVRPDFIRGSGGHGRHHFYGVFDGHGCSHVAIACQDRMHEIVAEEVERLGSGSAPALFWKGVMDRSFSRMDKEVADWRGGPRAGTCRCELTSANCDHVGSTAVVAVMTPEKIVVANCGDSRAVLCRGGAAVPLSTDHKPDRPDEMERIEAAGGRVIYWDGPRVIGVLAMSRAIGDGYLKPYVISEPEVTTTERTEEDECLILASDGLWDVVSNEMACGIARICLRTNRGGDGDSDDDGEGSGGEGGSDKACFDASMLLTKLALARQSADNVSVVVIDLKQRFQD